MPESAFPLHSFNLFASEGFSPALEEEGEAEIVVKGDGVERSAFFLCFAGAPVRVEFCCCLFSPLGEDEDGEREKEVEVKVVL